MLRGTKTAATQDILIVLSESGRADIAPVIDIDAERILAAGEVEYAVPIGDTKAYIGSNGRIFSFKATDDLVTDCKRIAALEQSTVLRQITVFEKERSVAAAPLPVGKMVLIGLVVLVIIVVLAVK